MRKHGANLYNISKAAVVVVSCVLSFCEVLLRGNIYGSDMRCTQLIHFAKNLYIHLSFGIFSLPVSKTNLSVHEDKNRVPYVKVSINLMFCLSFL